MSAKEKNLDPVVVEKLNERYSSLHPLIRHRSIEKARSLGELFDFLDGFPEEMPVVWNEKDRTWETTDLLMSKKLKV